MGSELDQAHMMATLGDFATEYLGNSELSEGKRKAYKQVQPFIFALLKKQNELHMEYTDRKVDNLKVEYEEKLQAKEDKIADLKSELRVHRNEQDALGCYNRRENLKICGVEYEAGENTNQIVKDVCKYAGREITDADISTCHRNGLTKENNQLPPGAATKPKKVLDIYVRFTRRDVKTEVFEKEESSNHSTMPCKI